MLLKLLKNNHPFVLFLIPILGVVLWIPALFNFSVDIQSANITNTTFIYNWVIQLISFYPKSSIIFALVLVIIESYVIIGLNFKYIFIENRTYLPAIIFLFFASILSSYQMLYPLLIGNLFLLFALNKALLIDKSKNHLKRYYESGLYLGLGSLFYPNIYVFIFIIWLTILILRRFNLREWFVSILGIITPFIFYFAILFLANQHHNIFFKLKVILTTPVQTLSFSNYSLVAIGFLTLIVLVSLLIGIGIVGVKKISIRKYYSLFFWYFIYIVILIFFHPSIGHELILPLAMPLSIFCSVFFIELRNKWVSEILFTLTMLSVFVIIWMQ